MGDPRRIRIRLGDQVRWLGPGHGMCESLAAMSTATRTVGILPSVTKLRDTG